MAILKFVIKADLGSLAIGHDGVQQLVVVREEPLQDRIMVLYVELLPGHLHASLQRSHVLQNAVEGNCTTQRKASAQRVV